jgi:hypothetical protein
LGKHQPGRADQECQREREIEDERESSGFHEQPPKASGQFTPIGIPLHKSPVTKRTQELAETNGTSIFSRVRRHTVQNPSLRRSNPARLGSVFQFRVSSRRSGSGSDKSGKWLKKWVKSLVMFGHPDLRPYHQACSQGPS